MLLVTGANGFVGRHLLADLTARGIAARGAVRAGGNSGSQAGEQVEIGDLNAHTNWSAALRGVTSVVHLAGLAHVDPRRVRDPLATYRRVNTEGTLRLANAAMQAGAQRFLFVSSVKVNGEFSGDKPFTADDVPSPSDPYGISKLEAERGLEALGGALRVAIVRPPLVYGPGVRANFLSLMRLVKRGMPLPLARVENRRSLVAVENLTDLLIRLVTDTSGAQGVFHVSDGEDLSTPELVRRIARALDVQPRLLPMPPWLLGLGAGMLGKRDVVQRLLGTLQVDISQTCVRLGWQPPVSVDVALARTAAWFTRVG